MQRRPVLRTAVAALALVAPLTLSACAGGEEEEEGGQGGSSEEQEEDDD